MGCGSLPIEGCMAGAPGLEQARTGASRGTLQVLSEEMVETDSEYHVGRSGDPARQIACSEIPTTADSALGRGSDSGDPRSSTPKVGRHPQSPHMFSADVVKTSAYKATIAVD